MTNFYRTRRQYLLAAIREKQAPAANPTIAHENRKILARLCGELDDLDTKENKDGNETHTPAVGN